MRAEESGNIIRKAFGYIESMYEHQGIMRMNGRWVFDPSEYNNLRYSEYFNSIPDNWKGEYPV